MESNKGGRRSRATAITLVRASRSVHSIYQISKENTTRTHAGYSTFERHGGPFPRYVLGEYRLVFIGLIANLNPLYRAHSTPGWVGWRMHISWNNSDMSLLHPNYSVTTQIRFPITRLGKRNQKQSGQMMIALLRSAGKDYALPE